MERKLPYDLTQEELNQLVGLSVELAEDLVKAAGLKPKAFHKNEMQAQVNLLKNVVEIKYDDRGVVVSARTQASIDRKLRSLIDAEYRFLEVYHG